MAGADAPDLAIGTLARLTGCKVETIRYYERIGILPEPPRNSGGQRRYRAWHLKRLNFVRRARDLGFTLADVRGLLRLVDEQDHSCEEVRTMALGHLEAVRARLTDLEAMETVLGEMVARCEGGKVPDCPIIDALYREPA
ncbi:MAG: helix-turn-helix domain-containing protein [Alphaproteobacteria bacterium]|nr:helix-turn-helix domain-containing protein [Alphaproteobacteria bacterium]